MKAWLIGYGSALVVMGALDALWLGWLARDFYRRELGDLMADPVRLVPAAAFYLAYPAGLVTLALLPRPDDLTTAVLRSALVGLVAYGTYDLTNLATIRHWSATLTAVDMAWGTAASAVAGAAAYLAIKAWG